jgi:hypothetical protein
MTKVCSKCNTRKNTEEFSFRNKNKGSRRAECKACFKPLSQNHYKKNRQAYNQRGIERRKITRDWILTYLSSKKCKDCGNSDIRVLEFDHVADNKSYNIAILIAKGYGLVTLNKEVEKCEVVCANCHKIRTDEKNNSYRHQYYTNNNL